MNSTAHCTLLHTEQLKVESCYLEWLACSVDMYGSEVLGQGEMPELALNLLVSLGEGTGSSFVFSSLQFSKGQFGKVQFGKMQFGKV